MKGFEKIGLQLGEIKTVDITLKENAFSYFIPHLNRFADEKSEFYLILYGYDVRNLPGMLAFVGIPMEVGEVLKNCRINKKPIPSEIYEKLGAL